MENVDESSTSSWHGDVEEFNDHSESSSIIRRSAPSIDRPRKRGATHSVGSPSKKRRSNATVNERYLDILNDMIAEAVSSKANANHAEPWIGNTPWSSDEQRVLFDKTLPTTGYNLKLTTGSLPNKSAMELLQVSLALKDSFGRRSLASKATAFVAPWDIPAATETSKACCEALETEADSVQTMEWDSDVRVEMSRYGPFWLIDHERTSDLDAIAAHNESEESEDARGSSPAKVDSSLLAANSLLCFSNFLDLSQRVFMNRPINDDADRQPQYPLEHGDGPSIFATALVDIHSLAVSVTKRLVVAALFQATSRLRATNVDNSHGRQLHVKAHDVITAVDVLGMHRDSVDYWIKAPRRLGLEVYRHDADRRSVKRNIRSSPLSYKEVESSLGTEMSPEAESDGYHSTSAKLHGGRDLYNMDGPRSSHENEDNSPFSNEGSFSESGSELTDEADTLDNYMEAYDQRNSRHVENRLWDVLEQLPPETVDLSEPEIPRAPRVTRKTEDELHGWHCQYISPWESAGRNVKKRAAQAPMLVSRRASERRGRSRGKVSRSVSPSQDSASTISSGEASAGSSGDSVRSRSGRTLHRISASAEGAIQATTFEGSPRRSRSRRASSHAPPPVYAFELGDGIPLPEPLPSDSSDEYRPDT